MIGFYLDGIEFEDQETVDFFRNIFNRNRKNQGKRIMRTTDQNHLQQKRLPNGRFAPKNQNNTLPVQKTTSPLSVLQTVVNAGVPSGNVPVTKLVSGGSVTPPVEPLVNHIALVIDESGSMGHLRNEVPKRYTEIVRSIRANARATGQKTTLTVVRFGVPGHYDQIMTQFFCADIESCGDSIPYVYSPPGGTPLLDATASAIDQLRARLDAEKKNVSFLVVTITDGEENQSLRYNRTSFKNLIDSVQATDRWTLTFSLPTGKKAAFCRNFNVPEGNCQEWEATTLGLELASHTTQAGVTHYYTNRSLGASNTRSFYTDLSKVSSTAIKQNLQDIQDKVKLYRVEKETEIRPFVEEKTGKPYSLGTAFYQLTKPEKIQAGKQILVKEKNSNAVYGGYDARRVLGIPEGTDLRVKPGNHANYDVFVQSTSTNRKLVRGSTLLLMK